MSRALPYRTPVDRVTAQPWVRLDGKGEVVGEAALAWDYNDVIRLSRVIHVDLQGALEDCKLPDDTALRVQVRYWSSNSRIRTVATSVPLRPAGVDGIALPIEISGSVLGGVLTIETALELAESRDGADAFSPRWAGTMLWRDTVRVPLEGEGGLLPVAPVSFANSPRLPDAAAWYVSLDFAEWGAAAMGCLLVLINTDLPVVARALAATDDGVTDILWGALSADIVADIVGRALDDDSFHPDGEWTSSDEEALTVGGLVSGLVRGFLVRPGEDVVEGFHRLRELRRRDPSMYTAEVQAGVRALGTAAS